MDAKEAIAVAKQYVGEMLADEQVANLSVEEIEPDANSSGGWLITLAFAAMEYTSNESAGGAAKSWRRAGSAPLLRDADSIARGYSDLDEEPSSRGSGVSAAGRYRQ